MLRAIIIDHDVVSKTILKTLIENFTVGINIIGDANNIELGACLIHDLAPDLIFLSLEMDHGSGFDILEKHPEYSSKVICMASSDTYAIEAIRHSVLDYVLKPFDCKELEGAVARAKNILQTANNLHPSKIEVKAEEGQGQIFLPSHKGTERIMYDNIILIEVIDKCVFFILEDGASKLVTKPLNFYEKILPNHQFYRIHKSHIVNTNKVVSIEGGRSGKVVLTNGIVREIASRRKTDFLTHISIRTS